MDSRPLLFAAKTQWKCVRLTGGLGTGAGSQAMKFNGMSTPFAGYGCGFCAERSSDARLPVSVFNHAPSGDY
jgi:hypothetical protein